MDQVRSSSLAADQNPLRAREVVAMAATARWCYSAAEQRRESRGSGLLSQYRRDSGWNEWANDARYPNQHWRMDGIFALARVTSAAPKS